MKTISTSSNCQAISSPKRVSFTVRQIQMRCTVTMPQLRQQSSFHAFVFAFDCRRYGLLYGPATHSIRDRTTVTNASRSAMLVPPLFPVRTKFIPYRTVSNTPRVPQASKVKRSKLFFSRTRTAFLLSNLLVFSLLASFFSFLHGETPGVLSLVLTILHQIKPPNMLTACPFSLSMHPANVLFDCRHII